MRRAEGRLLPALWLIAALALAVVAVRVRIVNARCCASEDDDNDCFRRCHPTASRRKPLRC